MHIIHLIAIRKRLPAHGGQRPGGLPIRRLGARVRDQQRRDRVMIRRWQAAARMGGVATLSEDGIAEAGTLLLTEDAEEEEADEQTHPL